MANRPMSVLARSSNAHVGHVSANQVEGDYHFHAAQVRAKDLSVYELLEPVEDASHTRDRKRSPPDSACAKGTRVEVVNKVTAWTVDDISSADEPHVLWVHGYAGSGKSAISQEVCDTSERQHRPVVSFFFFRNAGERSKIRRLATTLASQMAVVIPETEPFIRAAVRANPALRQPDQRGVSLRSRMHQLVYTPFKAAVGQGTRVTAPAKRSFRAWLRRLFHRPSEVVRGATTIAPLARGPFLIVLDGLDECDDNDEVQELIDGMLTFFNENPFIPLRVFITSRVEQHIQSRLKVPGVRLDNLVDHCSDDDIATFLDILFEEEKGRNPVIQAYISEHGEWPSADDKRRLIQHIGGSFIFGSTVFKFIMGLTAEPGSPATPIDRLPLALKMSPGLDGLYAQTLARSQELPHFLHIISTIALLHVPLPTSGVAELLGISTYEVINVLMNLQAIIQVPGTDDMPVTLFHTSLRDFLTTQTRSGPFFAHPRQHVHIFLRCLQCELVHRQRGGGLPTNPIQRRPAAAYALQYSEGHLRRGQHLFESAESDFAIQLCREALGLCPGAPELIQSLACVTLRHATHGGTLVDLEEAVSLNREALKFRPLSHPDRPQSLRALGDALKGCYRLKGKMVDLDEAIAMYREELELRPSPQPDRSRSLNNLGVALWDRYELTGTADDIGEAISLHREALKLRPSPHPDCSQSLNNLGTSLWRRYQRTKAASDLEESVFLFREALEHRPSPHPDRPESLNELAIALNDRHVHTGAATDLEESISLHREALDLRPYPHPDRSESLHNLGFALQARYGHTATEADLEEAISLYREALELRPSPHSERSASLTGLGLAICGRYQQTRIVADIDEAISMHREALELRPPPRPDRCSSLNHLGNALWSRHQNTRTMADIEEAICMHREALELRPPPHPGRSTSLNNLGNALWHRYQRTVSAADIEEVISMYRGALELSPPTHPDGSIVLNNLGNTLWERYQRTGSTADIEEAISVFRGVLELCPPTHPDRSTSLNNLDMALWGRYLRTRTLADLEEAISLGREALDLQPSPHPGRASSLRNLTISLEEMDNVSPTLPYLQEAIPLCEELLASHYPIGSEDRLETVNRLASLLQRRSNATQPTEDDDAYIAKLQEEARQWSTSTTAT